MSNKFISEFNEYNNLMKRLGSRTKTLEEYTLYRQGKLKGAKGKRAVRDPMKAGTFKRKSPEVPSGDSYDKFVATKKEQVYTGSNLVGIATMHKSNMVPVFKQQDAEDIARMRR